MIDPTLQSNLEPAARAFQRRLLLHRLTLCWGAAAGAGLLCFFASRITGWSSPYTIPVLLTAALVVAGEIYFRSQTSRPDFPALVRAIEAENPELRALLLTAVEQEPASPSGSLNYLQQRVVASALDHYRRHPWENNFSLRLSSARRMNWAALVCFVVILYGLRGSVPRKGVWAALAVNGVAVTPGDATLERGSGLVVLARFEGKLPADATLVVKPANENQRRIPLTKNLDDPVFGGSIPEVKGDLKYYVQYGAEKTPEYKVTVFEYPRLEHADAKITYPTYTRMPEKTIVDTRRVSAVEGSSLDYSFFLNKAVASAQLVAKDQPALALIRDTNSPGVYHTRLTLDQKKRFELVLVDDAGRTNKLPPEFVFDALKNRPPELKLTLPRGDQRVSPLEEVSFQAEASDDFGLRAYGLAFTMAGQETKMIQFGTNSKPNEKRPIKYLLPMESLGAEPGQLLSYYLWADDFGPDGKVRRTSSDMYFAEVRPFDEIFREQQGGQGGQGAGAMGGQQQSAQEKLLELQKDTISATWNLQRRETGSKASPDFKKDAVVVRDAQNDALEQVKGVAELVKSPESKILVQQAKKSMEKAAQKLGDAVTKNSATPLSPAVADEQSALQSLIKLQAHEFQVSKSKGQRGGGGGGGGQRQQQVDQLDLQQTDNNYETQREASPAQNQQQREQLQVANRLKELAQRQRDLNQRVKELQTSLQEAKSEQQKQEIRDRLKRLQEEEKDMLADVDELSQRMDRPENQSRMAESRQQLDQSRSEIQKTEQALKQESAAQALAAGTRAERELQQLQDDFRKKNSSQFAEEMRRMRQEARKMAQNQEEIAKKLNDLADAKQKTLNDSDERRAVATQMTEQKAGLTNLFSEMRQVSEQSETAEPLLSKQLYDTVRQSSQDDIEKPLDMSAELVQRGFLPQATPYEHRAHQAIDQLKSNVERAAQSVLGDDTEALKLAQRELDELSRELDSALAQTGGTNASPATGSQASARPGGRNSTNGASANQESASAQPGQNPSNTENPSGQAGQGERGQAGQGQSGQRGQGGRGQQGSGQETASGGQAGQKGRGAQGRGGQPGPGQPGAGQETASAGQPGQEGQGAPGEGGQRGQGGRDGQGGQDGQGGRGQRGQRGQGNRGGSGGGGGRVASAGDNLGGANNGGGGGGGGAWVNNPLTGDNFVDWSDRLRNVEEMVDLPDLRTDVARIRDRARAIRIEFKRLGKKPDWAVVRTQISAPLAEVRSRVGEELARRESKDALVPIDRDPVPAKFAERVKKYYEQLGKSD